MKQRLSLQILRRFEYNDGGYLYIYQREDWDPLPKFAKQIEVK